MDKSEYLMDQANWFAKFEKAILRLIFKRV